MRVRGSGPSFDAFMFGATPSPVVLRLSSLVVFVSVGNTCMDLDFFFFFFYCGPQEESRPQLEVGPFRFVDRLRPCR